MKLFVLKISPKRKWDFASLADFERVHQNVKMMKFKKEIDSLDLVIEGLSNIGANVKQFELNDCEVSMRSAIEVLRTMEHLTRVDLVNVKIADDHESSKLPEFQNLRHLKIVECDSAFEIFLQCKQLVEICFQADERKNLDFAPFEALLRAQKKLKLLEIINVGISNFLETDSQFPFQLKSLTVHHCHFREKENFERFLERQQQLEEVDIAISNLKLNLDRVRYYDDSLVNILRLKHLQQLTIDFGNYVFASTSFLTQTFNPNLKNLTLSLEEKSSIPIDCVLKSFPNIESLALSAKEISEVSLEYINQNHQNLRDLKVSKFPSAAFARLKFKNLKSLHVHETNIELEHWMTFIENNPNIVKLVINFTFFIDLSEEFIDMVTRKLKLEHLELIDKWIGMRNEIYVTICENCKSLKYLKLHNINVEKDFDEGDKNYLRSKDVRFHLFNDESLNTAMIPF